MFSNRGAILLLFLGFALLRVEELSASLFSNSFSCSLTARTDKFSKARTATHSCTKQDFKLKTQKIKRKARGIQATRYMILHNGRHSFGISWIENRNCLIPSSLPAAIIVYGNFKRGPPEFFFSL